jgi:hypothetical protein
VNGTYENASNSLLPHTWLLVVSRSFSRSMFPGSRTTKRRSCVSAIEDVQSTNVSTEVDIYRATTFVHRFRLHVVPKS